MLFHIKHHWWALGIKRVIPVGSCTIQQYTLPIGQLYIFHGKRVLKIDKSIKLRERILNRLSLDAVIVSGNQRQQMALIRDMFETKRIIFDTSNKKWRIKKWKAECDAMHLPYYDVAEYAFVENLKL
jgi:hypothetical protein